MKTFRTFYRLAVMAMTVAVVYMAWQLYGPPPEKQEWLKQRGLELVDCLVDRFQDWRDGGQVAQDDPRLQMPPAGPAPFIQQDAQPILSPAPMTGGAVAVEENLNPPIPATAPPVPVTVDSAPLGVQPAAYTAPASTPAPNGTAQLEPLLARLQQLGVSDTRLEPWGSSGEYYRFSCRAPWNGGSSYSRHFESVAIDPATAVDEVTAAIEAWRATGASGL